MTTYSTCCWLACLATSLLLGLSLWRDRSLLVRPSVFVILAFHLMIQWAAAVNAERIYSYLPEPWAFALLSQGFPLLGLMGSLVSAKGLQRRIWQHLVNHRPMHPLRQSRSIMVLGFCVVAVDAYYFATVPASRTGLYAILFNPQASSMAREESFKLVSSPLLKYGFNIMTGTVAPLLAVLLMDRLLANLRPLRHRPALVSALGILALLFAVSPTGARSYPAKIILVLLLAWLLRKGMPVSPAYIIPAALAVLALPTLLTVLREGRPLSLENLSVTLSGGIANRMLFVPMQTGLWHAHYAQTVGHVGIRGIPKLAVLAGATPVDMSNLIGRLYALNPLATVSANTSYVFSYYGYFGVLSFPFSLLGLWLLDGALWVYRKLPDDLLPGVIATVGSGSLALVSTDYTIALMSHGLLAALLVGLALARIGPRHPAVPREPVLPRVPFRHARHEHPPGADQNLR